MTLTRDLAWAAATDAGMHSMRAGRRTSWNEDDYQTAARELIRLWPEDVAALETAWRRDHPPVEGD